MVFWVICEFIFEVNRWIGLILLYDILVFLLVIFDFINKVLGELVKLGDFCINCFGYLGDGNLYYNVFFFKG